MYSYLLIVPFKQDICVSLSGLFYFVTSILESLVPAAFIFQFMYRWLSKRPVYGWGWDAAMVQEPTFAWAMLHIGPFTRRAERPTTLGWLRLDLCPRNMAASVNGRVLTTPPSQSFEFISLSVDTQLTYVSSFTVPRSLFDYWFMLVMFRWDCNIIVLWLGLLIQPKRG